MISRLGIGLVGAFVQDLTNSHYQRHLELLEQILLNCYLSRKDMELTLLDLENLNKCVNPYVEVELIVMQELRQHNSSSKRMKI